MKLTPCKLKEIVREEARSMLNEEGFENLPPGWDRESLMSFARNLTGKTKADPEGFFTACMEEMEDKFDDPERFCASLKDEYLQTTDWRGESVNKSRNTKLTKNELREVIREELLKEYEERPVVQLTGVTGSVRESGVVLVFSLVDGPELYNNARENAESLQEQLSRKGLPVAFVDHKTVDRNHMEAQMENDSQVSASAITSLSSKQIRL